MALVATAAKRWTAKIFQDPPSSDGGYHDPPSGDGGYNTPSTVHNYMPTWIALFRGINVGGKNSLPMAKLKTDFETLKLSKVQTYIQSGNVVFQSSSSSGTTLAKKIGDLVESEHGFRPSVLLLTKDELETAIERNPFPDATSEPTSLHFFFLDTPASKANLAGLEKIKAASESFRLIDKVLYLHAPDGVGRSKLAAGAEKLLGVVATARNYRTVEKLRAMVSEV